MVSVVFVHGFAASADQWQFLAQHFSDADIPHYKIELLGHGNGLKPVDIQSYSTSRTLEQMDLDIDRITEGKIILIAHSLGGYLSLAYAIRHPEKVEQLILINPLYRKDQVFPRLNRLIRMVRFTMGKRNSFPQRLVRLTYPLSILSHPVYSPEARQVLVDGLANLSPRVFNVPVTWGDLSAQIPDIRIPTLLLWSDQDRTLDPQLYPPLIELLPDCSERCLAGEDHNPHLTRPDWLWSYIEEFLETSIR